MQLARIRFAALLLVSLMLTAVVPGQSARAEDDGYAILLDSGTLNPIAGDYAAGLAFLQSVRSESAHMLVQLYETPTAPEREAIAARGVRLLSYLPNRAWLASVPAGITGAQLADLGVRWLAPLELEQKAHARVLEADYSPWSEYENGQRIFAISMHEDISADAGRLALDGWVGEIGGYIRSINTYIVTVNPADILGLALLDEVRWVDERPPVMTGVNDGAREALGVNPLHEAPYDLDGRGSNVLVYDVGLIGTHNDFGTRVTAGEGGSAADHSTHCGGTVGGNGANSGGTYKGMAPNTRLTSYLYESCSPYCLYNSPQDIEENYEEGMYTFGAQLTSNSLGSNIASNGYNCTWEGDYEITSQLLDAISTGSLGRPLLSCWAAGNERHNGRCGTTYRTTGVPAGAKNPIVVGATMSNDHSMSWFSSWGPVDDGRIRPDICAPGCQSGGDGGITSTLPGNRYGAYCGTSMATPATAGCIALILQQTRMSPVGMFPPLPSTIKALLINTAYDYFNVGPDYQFGYGEIRPRVAIDHLRDGLAMFEAVLDHGDHLEYELEVAGAMTELKATVAWSDPPGECLAQFELVNNLDVWFESPSCVTHRPWILDPAHPEVAATRGIDSRNNVEQVLVNSPEVGVWTLHVDGTNVPEGPQRFSVVANVHRYTDTSDLAEGGNVRAPVTTCAPNPFVQETKIAYSATTAAEPVEIEIRDVSGRVVRMLADLPTAPGLREVAWDGRDTGGRELPAGVYFYRLGGQETAGNGARLLLVR